MSDLHWLTAHLDFILDDEIQTVARFAAILLTTSISLITFYLRLKDRSMLGPPRLGLAKSSWDAKTRRQLWSLPPYPKVAPFPFVSSDLGTREKSDLGWFTITQFFIWNAGKGIIFGPLVKQTTVLQICIPHSIEQYQIRTPYSNDPDMKVTVGEATADNKGEVSRISVAFDFMHPQKGIQVTVLHNSANDEAIKIRAFSELTPVPVWGIRHVVRFALVKKMTWFADTLLLISTVSVLAAFSVGDIGWAVVLLVLFWVPANAACYLHRSSVYVPDSLIWTD